MQRRGWQALNCLSIHAKSIANVLPGENVKLFAGDTNLFISGIDSSGHFGDIQCQTMA